MLLPQTLGEPVRCLPVGSWLPVVVALCTSCRLTSTFRNADVSACVPVRSDCVCVSL
jgi:hypothetical protein